MKPADELRRIKPLSHYQGGVADIMRADMLALLARLRGENQGEQK